ncbi:Uncharacterised protein [uncultured archaeon]|nr:Uncharacterised protein [uncultured archaeon]
MIACFLEYLFDGRRLAGIKAKIIYMHIFAFHLIVDCMADNIKEIRTSIQFRILASEDLENMELLFPAFRFFEQGIINNVISEAKEFFSDGIFAKDGMADNLIFDSDAPLIVLLGQDKPATVYRKAA